MNRFNDDALFARRSVALWHCEARDVHHATPQRVGRNTGSFADKRLCDTTEGQELLRSMVNA